MARLLVRCIVDERLRTHAGTVIAFGIALTPKTVWDRTLKGLIWVAKLVVKLLVQSTTPRPVWIKLSIFR